MKLDIKKKKKKGFTLIELIIVIAIIAIIAALAIPNLGKVTNNSKKKADIADAKTIASATASLLADNSIKPSTSDSATTYQADAAAAAHRYKIDAAATSNVGGTIAKYLNSIPGVKTPGAGTDFYVAIDDNQNVTVYTGTSAATATAEAYPSADPVFK